MSRRPILKLTRHATTDEAESASQWADQYQPGESGYADPRALWWFYTERYPLVRLANAPRARWFQQEKKMWADEGMPYYYEDMLTKPIAEPIVVFDDGLRGWIWDGNHRVGAYASLRKKAIKALVGVPFDVAVKAMGG